MKNKIIKMISLLIIILLVFEIYTLGKTNRLYYVPLGDALAVGQNPYGEIGYSYTDYLKDYLSNHKRLSYYSKEYVKSGSTTESIISEIEHNNYLKKDLRESDLVTLSIGANDILAKIDLHSLKVTELSNIKEVIRKILPDLEECLKTIRKYAKGKMIIVGYYNPIPFLFNTSSNDLDKLFAYIDDEYQILADKYKCEYVPLYQLFKMNSNFLPNPLDYHPNSKGYKEIANKIIKNIKI